MMNIDVSKLREFEHASAARAYCSLIAELSKIPRRVYEEQDIYYELHHIIPRCEGGTDDESNLIPVPFYLHFRLHVYRAREATSALNQRRHYASANLIISSHKLAKNEIEFIHAIFPDEIYEAKQRFLESQSVAFKQMNQARAGFSYVDVYGEERATEIKKKIGEWTRNQNLTQSDETREKRRTSVREYANHRPEAHNRAISESHKGDKNPRARRVICLTDGREYTTIKSAAEENPYGVSINSIKHCCKGTFKQVKGTQWAYK
jgi:hypothetical protein